MQMVLRLFDKTITVTNWWGVSFVFGFFVLILLSLLACYIYEKHEV